MLPKQMYPDIPECEKPSKYPRDEQNRYHQRSGEGLEPNPGRSRRQLPLPPPPPYVRDKRVGTRMIIVAFASCACVCASIVLAALAAVAFWNNSHTSHLSQHINEHSRKLVQGPSSLIRDNPIEKENRHDFLDKLLQEPSRDNNQNAHESKDSDINSNENGGNQIDLLEKLAKIKHILNTKDNLNSLDDKPEYHPEIDPSLNHQPRKIEKKDHAKPNSDIPEFKPTLPDIFINSRIHLPDGYITGFEKSEDVDYYYNDDLLYDDYVQSNSLTNYILEKIQELYAWIKSDPELEGVKNSTHQVFEKGNPLNNSLSTLLVALNESIVESNATIVMTKLKELYYSENNTVYANQPKRNLLNSTDLFTFGLLSLDVILLHNIQLMAWNSQVGLKEKMLQDPEVFAFNSLFMEKNSVEALRRDPNGRNKDHKNHNSKTSADEWWGNVAVESVLEMGLGTARAALHLAKAYRNAKSGVSVASGALRGAGTAGSSAALMRLRASYSSTSRYGTNFSQLDCIWFVYCRNLVATAALPSPYGTMAKINGFALRLAAGSVPASRALETLMLEALTGFDQVHCRQLLPRCSQANAAEVVLESVRLGNKWSDS